MAAAYKERLGGQRRKNLSVGYFENGKLLGYVIAYVGYDKEQQREIIYISDLAVNNKKGKAAGLLLQRLFRSIQDVATMFKTEYGKDIRLLLQATTGKDGSYTLFMPQENDSEKVRGRKQQRLAKYGLKIEKQESIDESRAAFEFSIKPLENKYRDNTSEAFSLSNNALIEQAI